LGGKCFSLVFASFKLTHEIAHPKRRRPTCRLASREQVPCGMTLMHPERPACAAGYSGMETSTEYRRFAQECRRLARDAKSERHRNIMEEMAQAWDQLAKEADGEASHASP
jgi:hypothetical protein